MPPSGAGRVALLVAGPALTASMCRDLDRIRPDFDECALSLNSDRWGSGSSVGANCGEVHCVHCGREPSSAIAGVASVFPNPVSGNEFGGELRHDAVARYRSAMPPQCCG